MLKSGKSIILLVMLSVLLDSCAPVPSTTQSNNPDAPQPGDEKMVPGDVEIVSATVLSAESFPPQVSVSLTYRLPTPCHQLRVVSSQPDNQKRVRLDIYAVAPKNKPCNLMALLTPQEASINLGSIAAGHYTLWINGKQASDFDVQ
jgi:hypothetical protein